MSATRQILEKALGDLVKLIDAALAQFERNGCVSHSHELCRSIERFVDTLSQIPGGRDELVRRATFVENKCAPGTHFSSILDRCLPDLFKRLEKLPKPVSVWIRQIGHRLKKNEPTPTSAKDQPTFMLSDVDEYRKAAEWLLGAESDLKNEVADLLQQQATDRWRNAGDWQQDDAARTQRLATELQQIEHQQRLIRLLHDGVLKLTDAERHAYRELRQICRGVQREADRMGEVDGCWYLYHVYLAGGDKGTERDELAKKALQSNMGGGRLKDVRAASESLFAWAGGSFCKRDGLPRRGSNDLVASTTVERGTKSSECVYDQQSVARLLSVYTNGLADDRIETAASLVIDNALTVNEKLQKIDSVMPFPPTASAAQLGQLIGVTKQAVLKSDWWIQHRKGRNVDEVHRRLEGHRARSKHHDLSRTNVDCD